eukprot:214432-Rhodomonas_salina.2
MARTCYATPSTEIAHGAILLLPCYAVSGTDLAYAVLSAHALVPYNPRYCTARMVLRARYAMSGTDVAGEVFTVEREGVVLVEDISIPVVTIGENDLKYLQFGTFQTAIEDRRKEQENPGARQWCPVPASRMAMRSCYAMSGSDGQMLSARYGPTKAPAGVRYWHSRGPCCLRSYSPMCGTDRVITYATLTPLLGDVQY